MNKMVYKGYSAKVEFDPEENELVGQIEGIKDLVVFSSKNCDEIEKIFHESVDGYLESCKMAGKDPDKSFTGSFNVRIDPLDHRLLDELAKKEDTTLNNEVCLAIRSYLENKNRLKINSELIRNFVESAFSDYAIHQPAELLIDSDDLDIPCRVAMAKSQKEYKNEPDSAKA